MNQKTNVDYIVVGQGLAGSAVALHLLDRNKTVHVIDEFEANTSSRIAAGMFNPVTGQNSVKTWLAHELFSYLDTFYSKAEQITGKKFYYPKKVYRPFASIQEQNEWMGRSSEPEYQVFVEEIFLKSTFQEVHDPFGGLLLRGSGYVRTFDYVEAVRTLLQSKGAFSGDIFDPDDLHPFPDHVEYRGFSASAIVFCQGVRGLDNKFFRKLPVRPLKGETLTIKTDFTKDVILNRGVYMVPEGAPGQFRVGSTYRLKDTSKGVSKDGRTELEQKLKDLYRLPFEIIGEDWGVRPTTTDRRPLLGNHPEFERLIIFNGLGTKGVSLAPYFSNVLTRWLDNSGTLPNEVILTRYK